MTASISTQKVLITGANGFIGLHTTLRLLQFGYTVRATVRNEAHQKNILQTLSNHAETSKLEFALADLLKDDGWREAARGCEFVIHTASPYRVVPPKEADTLILPARDGTLRVLRAAQAEGVKRFVMLSSIVAVSAGHTGENKTFDASDWSVVKPGVDPYSLSKTLAERAAWEFIQGAENKNQMEMVAVNPTNVFGPVLDNHFHTSVEWFRTLMHAEVPGVSRTMLDFVDVRDVAEILIKAIIAPEAAGKRFICNAVSIPLPEFAEILQQNFSQRGYRIPTSILPNLLIKLNALLMPKLKAVADSLNWKYAISTEQTRTVFDWQPRPYKQTIIDMAESLIKFGLV